jgi:predicted acylesterase/phospholipase RssA
MILTATDVVLIVCAAATPTGAVVAAAYHAGKKVGEMCTRLELILTRLDNHEIKLTDIKNRVKRIERKELGDTLADVLPTKHRQTQSEGVRHGG